MATRVGRLFHDENLKAGGSKATNKGVMKTSRRPLGDVSNRGKPDLVSKASKKPALTNLPEIIYDESNNKNGAAKPSGKVQTRSTRKALSDVSNVRAPLQKASTGVAKEAGCDYENEGFLHDHEQCIKAMREGDRMDAMDILWMINGPTPSKVLSPPKVEQECSIYSLKEIPEEDDWFSMSPIKRFSSPHCSPLSSPDRYTSVFPIEDCDFQLIGSP